MREYFSGLSRYIIVKTAEGYQRKGFWHMKYSERIVRTLETITTRWYSLLFEEHVKRKLESRAALALP